MQTVKAAEGGVVTIGRLGENGRTTVLFDVSQYLTEYSGATVSLVARRPGDVDGYPVTDGVSESSGVVSWVVSDIDTGVVGIGSATVYITLGDVLAKSLSYKTRILYADAVGMNPPDPFADWTTAVFEAAEEATAAAASAAEDAASVHPSDADDLTYILGI